MSNAAIEFMSVRKRFGAAEVLRGVDLRVDAVEFVGLAGVNGAGKTTLIKCLLDFCGVDGGRITLFGKSHLVPSSRKAIAFLPERFLPPYYLSGEDFLRHTARLNQHAYDSARIARAMDALSFDASALTRSVRSYSKGMTQKLGLIATFVTDHRFYILDEPMSGLDPLARAGVKKLLAGLRAAGRGLLLTSHALPDIEEVCDRIIVLHRGVPYFAGSPRQLCQDYGQVPIEQAFLRCIETSPDDRAEQQTHAVNRR